MKLIDCVKKDCNFVEVAFKDWSDFFKEGIDRDVYDNILQ